MSRPGYKVVKKEEVLSDTIGISRVLRNFLNQAHQFHSSKPRPTLDIAFFSGAKFTSVKRIENIKLLRTFGKALIRESRSDPSVLLKKIRLKNTIQNRRE